MKTKIMVALFRQKEALKKEILRKRALLERELQSEIQVSFLYNILLKILIKKSPKSILYIIW